MKQILKKPVITEKSMSQTPNGKYSFVIYPNVGKVEVAKEVKKIYKVDPVKVNIINIKSRIKKYKGRYQGKTGGYKKAIVTVKKGQKIKEFDVKET